MACDRDVPDAAEAPPLRVEYAGCDTVLRGPVCVLKESRGLRLWVDAPPDVRLELTAGGRLLKAAGTAVQGGLRFELEVPETASAVAVRATGEEAEATWNLELAEPDRPDWLERAEELGAAGRLEEARRLLEDKTASPRGDEQGIALGRLARVELRQGRAGRSREILARAIRAHRDAGRVSGEVDDATVLVYLLLQERRFSEARAVLGALPRAPDGLAEVTYYAAYYRGLLAGKIGDARSALRHLTAAAEQAERVGLDRERRLTEQVLGWNLRRLGRAREAAGLYSRLHEEARQESRPCDRAVLLNNHAWSLLLALEGGGRAAAPAPLLETALELLAAEDCVLSADRRVDMLVNLALAHHHGGRPGEATGALSRARELSGSPRVHQVLWWLDVEGRLALDAGRAPAALELYVELAELAASTLSPEAEWRSAVGRARSLEVLGQRPAALAALAEAEALLEEESLQVPLDEGRETFLAQRETATRRYLDLLLTGDRAAEAFEVARRARSRMLRGLRQRDRLASLSAAEQERWDRVITEYQTLRAELDAAAAADWRLPADRLSRARAERASRHRELRRVLDQALAILDARGSPPSSLPPPGAGEVVLAFHPMLRGWVGFAATPGGVAARRLEVPEDALDRPAELAALLLEPFATEIAGARRVRVLPYGVLRAVDFHALPFAGDVLLAARPVVYGLDLQASSPPPRKAPATPNQALIVADPNGNLPAARAEAEAVRRALEDGAGEWTVQVLEGPRAHGDAVRQALARASLFHYAGHGAFAGRGGWESALPLAEGTRLTLGDVLALERAPEWVVLSGCETGRSSREAPVETVGLAQAFLAAGSGRVIAAVRPVGDRAAAALVAALYEDAGAAPDLGPALRRAQLAWRRAEPAADWPSFRVFEP